MSYKLQEVSLMQVKEEALKDSASTSRFVIEPLSPGYGLTVGNALRRVLLSSLEGAAITSIRIDGVSHEFSTIDGVREDVVDIILNLKKVRFMFESNEPQIIVLDAKTEGSVTAKNFKCPTGVEVINKDLVIANLTKNGKLLIEATVERGRGYSPTEARKDDKLPIGVVAIDAAYSPVTKVNFQIENTRVGKMTNFDRLILEIGTDGSITPNDALQYASTVIVEHFSILAGAQTLPEEVSVVSDETVEAEAPVKKTRKSAKKTDE